MTPRCSHCCWDETEQVAIDALSGAISGVATVFVGHPLDTLRVRMQTCTTTPAPSTWAVAKSIVRAEGVPGLFRGILPPMAAVGLASTLAFTSNEAAKSFCIRQGWGPAADGTVTARWLTALFASGFFGGAVVSCASTPSTLLKIQLQVTPSPEAATHPFRATVTAGKLVYREHGLRGFYHGHRLQFLMETIGRGLYFTVYEVAKAVLGVPPPTGRRAASNAQASSGTPLQRQAHGLAPRLIAAAVSGMVMWTLIYPLDVVRAQYMTTPQGRSASIIDIVRRISSTAGVAGFYRGLPVTLVRAVPVACTVLPMFDYVNAALGDLLL